MKCIFISRHAPTDAQNALAAQHHWDLVHVGDVDAFDAQAVTGVITAHKEAAVACVHPVIALAAHTLGRDVVVFKNETRPGVDGKPTFVCGGMAVIRAQATEVHAGALWACTTSFDRLCTVVDAETH